jgi:hypothetical protein
VDGGRKWRAIARRSPTFSKQQEIDSVLMDLRALFVMRVTPRALRGPQIWEGKETRRFQNEKAQRERKLIKN